jgi:hypothetical protein
MPHITEATLASNDVDSSNSASPFIDILKKLSMNFAQMVEIKLSLDGIFG